MLFLEDQAQLLLVLHVAAAAALVAASTHWVIWMRHYPRRQFGRHRAVRRFAFITAALFATAFVLGNLMYPVYKVRVRLEYLDHGSAVVRDYRERLTVRAATRRNYRQHTSGGVAAPEPEGAGEKEVDLEELPRATARAALWFDVKEHWTALGLALSGACALLFAVWDPRRAGASIAPLVFAMAVAVSFVAWMAAFIGITVASYRSVGGVG